MFGSIAKVKEEIIKKAEVEADKIIEEAKKKAEEIKKEIIEEAKKKAEEIVEKARKEAEVEADKIIGQARYEIRAARNRKKNEIVSRIFYDAERILDRYTSDDKRALEETIRLTKAASKELEGEDIKVKVPVRFRNEVDTLKRELGVEVEAEDTLKSKCGGVVLTKDGRIWIETTLESRMNEARDKLRLQVIRILSS